MIIFYIDDFYDKIVQQNIFNDTSFDLSSNKLSIQSLNHNCLTFNNCVFNCDNLEFNHINNPELILEFNKIELLLITH